MVTGTRDEKLKKGAPPSNSFLMSLRVRAGPETGKQHITSPLALGIDLPVR
ncbi:unnamed protein product [Musa banksii]